MRPLSAYEPAAQASAKPRTGQHPQRAQPKAPANGRRSEARARAASATPPGRKPAQAVRPRAGARKTAFAASRAQVPQKSPATAPATRPTSEDGKGPRSHRSAGRSQQAGDHGRRSIRRSSATPDLVSYAHPGSRLQAAGDVTSTRCSVCRRTGRTAFVSTSGSCRKSPCQHDTSTP